MSDKPADEWRDKFFCLARIVTTLLWSLPKCDQCKRPATRAWKRGEARYCDKHGEGVPDYPRATPLRETFRMLKELGGMEFLTEDGDEF